MDAAGFHEALAAARANLAGMQDAPTHRHVVAIHRAPGGYFARVLDLPGCISRGATQVEAIENVREMIRLHAVMARLAAAEKPKVSLEISA